MSKLTTLLALLISLTATRAFVAPRPSAPSLSVTRIEATLDTRDNEITTKTKIVSAFTTAIVAATPLATLAAATQDDDYVYGAVAAPGGLGLAAGLGVLAILTAAVPVLLSPGEDAFNEMKERDQGKWGKR